jgi:tetratricopeptide (TPR) repeat protein
LADLHARSGDVLNALLIVERGLIYSKNDADLLAKKESYYFSVDPERIRAVKDKIASWFDVAYCTRKVQAVANLAEPDLDTLDWGLHLATLARIVQPNLHSVMVAQSRILMRKGERDAAISLLEDVREQPKGSGDEEDAWYLATRLLADLYLNELGRPDLAIQAYTAYREYQKSGAETLFQLAKAYEANSDIPSAIQIYQVVTAYEKHPRYWDATEAVRKLKGG